MPFTKIRGTDLFYEIAGKGEPLVLVHGGFFDHRMWMHVVPLLSERFQVVTLDTPGHGQSGGYWDPTWTWHQVVDETVEYLAAFVEQLDLSPAHFAGQSLGGAFLLHLASRRPDLFLSMSLHEPPVLALLDDEFKTVLEAQIAAFSFLRSGDIETGISRFVETVGGNFSAFSEPFKEMFRQNARNYQGASLIDPAALAVPDEGLNEFLAPVQFTKGDLSPRFFHVSIGRVAAMIPGAEIVTINGGGHAPMLGPMGAEYATVLTEFIENSRIARAASSSTDRQRVQR